MLTWRQNFRASGKLHFDTHQSESGPEAIRAAIVEAWIKLLDNLHTVPSESWSILLAYITTEIGGVTFYATTREDPNAGQSDLSVMLTVGEWAILFEDLAYSWSDDDDDEGSDDDSDRGAKQATPRSYQAFLAMMAHSIEDALTDPRVASRISALAEREDFAIHYCDQGESVYTANLIWMWGKKPPSGFPASTPRELFTGLMHLAQIAPDNCLKLDGDHVIEATFFGAEFRDKCVDILESVPNVGELCAKLQVLNLKYTKIRPDGVARLKVLFPGADVHVIS
jgi:hypothetical protein